MAVRPSTHRGRGVCHVVAQVLALRDDGGVGLQDSRAHVQDAGGPVVQAVLEGKREATSPGHSASERFPPTTQLGGARKRQACSLPPALFWGGFVCSVSNEISK